jgi:transcriptional regulator with XRE-family HTH domain
MNTKEKLISKLKNKKYRDAFVATYIDQGIPFQIRALREQRHWSQEKLASEAGMKQEVISRFENLNNKSFTLKKLKQIAAGFDVGLIVRFVPISSIVKWVNNLPNTSLEVLSFEEEPYFQDIEEERTSSFVAVNFITKREDQKPDSVNIARPQELRDVSVGYNYRGDEIPDDTDGVQMQIS